MPVYITSPFKPPVQLLVPGTPSYVFGSWNDRTGPTIGSVISDSAVTTTGTLTFRILSGNVPVVGALITVRGTSNASGHFNVTNATILTVSAPADPDAGIYTVTYAITSSTLSTTGDSGEVCIPQPEIGEALTAGAASVPVAAPYAAGNTNYEKTISVNVKFPSSPTTAVVVLEAANFDLDSEYATIATVVDDASPNPQDGQIEVESNFRFYRLKVLSTTGGSSPTVVGSIEL